ncbi:hypothetical protein GIB67_025278 [Kingdonia uniflora]|uniref:Uncharacterized protein n=1 Tax=Kingdonia uniflora TaxID=39325 RepID=A0A7J7NBV8_9MAGN|nr:hypothetical protein GIB67_025278 [Kingdonia uniflora]
MTSYPWLASPSEGEILVIPELNVIVIDITTQHNQYTGTGPVSRKMLDDESRLVHNIIIINIIPRSQKNELFERMKVFLYAFKSDVEIDLSSIIIEEMIDASTKMASRSLLPFAQLVMQIMIDVGYKVLPNKPEVTKAERLDANNCHKSASHLPSVLPSEPSPPGEQIVYGSSMLRLVFVLGAPVIVVQSPVVISIEDGDKMKTAGQVIYNQRPRRLILLSRSNEFWSRSNDFRKRQVLSGNKNKLADMKVLMGLSGFGWDPINCPVTADKEVWDALLEVEKKLQKGKKFKDYEVLVELMGDEGANGDNIRSVGHLIINEEDIADDLDDIGSLTVALTTAHATGTLFVIPTTGDHTSTQTRMSTLTVKRQRTGPTTYVLDTSINVMTTSCLVLHQSQSLRESLIGL